MALSALEQLKAKAAALKASSTTPSATPSATPVTAPTLQTPTAPTPVIDSTPVASTRKPLPALGKLQPRTPVAAIAETRATAAAASVAQVQQQVQMAMTTVPDNIIQLNPAINNIAGLQADSFKQILASTYKALVEDQPDLPKMLELINKNLRQYEELSYLLSPEQLGLYFDGLMKVTATKINTTKPKAVKEDKKPAAALSATDLIL
jgi:hypothetical protein